MLRGLCRATSFVLAQLTVEYADGTVFGCEINSGGGPSTDDAKHQCWLRDEVGDCFLT